MLLPHPIAVFCVQLELQEGKDFLRLGFQLGIELFSFPFFLLTDSGVFLSGSTESQFP